MNRVRFRLTGSRSSRVSRWIVPALCISTLLLTASTLSAQTLAGGSSHSVVLKPDGTVWTFGLNSDGQLGDGTTTTRRTPIQVTGLSNIVAVAAGLNHSLALQADGTLWAWGRNQQGQLGDSTTTDRTTPTIVGLTSVVAVAAGQQHSLAIRANGEMYAWGRNSHGQLGIGSTTSSSTPTMILSAGGAAVAGGGTHTLVVKTDGTVWAAGWNGYGELGDGTQILRTSLVQMSGISGATAVAAGMQHSLILLGNGTLKAVGDGTSGQLGEGTNAVRLTPVSVSSLTDVVAISTGSQYSVARKSDGTLWLWGQNSSGQLGDGTTTGRLVPTLAVSLPSISDVGAGGAHSLAVDATGVVYTWGANDQSQLGDGATSNRSTPDAISGPNYEWKVSSPAFSVGSGTYTTDQTVVVTAYTPGAVIHYTQDGSEPTESDTVVSSGASVLVNRSQTLRAKAWKTGMPSSSTASVTYTMLVGLPSLTPWPTTYTTPQSVTISSITPGALLRYTLDGSTPSESSLLYSAPFIVNTTTMVKAIGFKSDWTPSSIQSGTYTMNFGTLSAPSFSLPGGPYESGATVSLSAQAGATIRYTTNGSSPTSTSAIYTTPLAVTTSTTIKARAFHPDYVTSAESAATFTINVASPTFTPGGGTYTSGQTITVETSTTGATIHYTLNGAEPTTSDPIIGSGATLAVGNYTLKANAWKTGATTMATTTATYAVTGEVSAPVISLGGSHGLAIRHDGTVWGWGSNGGRLGDGSVTNRLLPVMAAGITGTSALSAGADQSLVLLNTGAVVAFGSNQFGQLGDGTQTYRLVPTAVSGLNAGVRAVASGFAHSLAVKDDTTVIAWGRNAVGELGDGTTTMRLVPTPVVGLSDVVAIAASQQASYALKADGSLWSWGWNATGQLGDGTTISRSTPAQISTLANVVSVHAGGQYAIALLSDGSVAAWGHNYSGQLGDGSSFGRLTPVAMTGLSSVTAISAGYTHSLALKTDGTVWATGGNDSGQLGDGTTANRSSMAQVIALSGIVHIAAGGYSSMALAADGTVWAWGSNSQGQLGDGTTTNRLTPVAISGPGMNWRVATPTITLSSGLYFASQATTVACTDPTATIHYTTTGLDPTPADPTIASGGTLPIDHSLLLKVSAWKDGAPTSIIVSRSFELKVVSPTLTPGTGAFGAAQSVAVGTTTPNATFRYTLDGTEPTASSPSYSSPITIADTRTVKARAYRTGWTPSDSGHASYWISAGTVAAPTISPVGGPQDTPPLVSINTTTGGAAIRVTLDGTDPNGSSPLYRYPFRVLATTIVKARAFKAGFVPSPTATAMYEVDTAGATATPAIVPGGGWFATKQTVTATGPVGATLRYSTTGADPTESDAIIASGGAIVIDRAQILKVRAWQAGLAASAVRRADFVITGAVSAGLYHSLALDAQGVVWAWGGNGHGQVGLGATSYSGQLTPVSVLTNATAVSAGYLHSLAAKADGTVWSWGSNNNSYLGRTGNPYAPGQVAGLTNVIAVAAGSRHSLVLKADGTVWTWGGNDHGQLGIGTPSIQPTPVQVPALSGIVAIAAGLDFSLALQADGAGGGLVWAWGHNGNGQLGDGSFLSRFTPTLVTGLTTVTQVAAGYTHGVALMSTGRVGTWGDNAARQLGLGVVSSQSVPQFVEPLQRVWALAAGGSHALALDQVQVWGWGQNLGQLGVGTGIPVADTPHRSRLSGAVAVAAGDSHSLAIAPSGQLLVFGSGAFGNLGTGNSTAQYTPVSASGLSLVNNAWLAGDADADGLASWREYLLGTDPLDADTNDNGIPDGVDELNGARADDPDTDHDGVPNWTELANGTDPFRADTDGDGVNDVADAFPLDPLRSLPLSSNPADTTPPVITLREPVSARPIPD